MGDDAVIEDHLVKALQESEMDVEKAVALLKSRPAQ